jgi:hypothetical protein
MFKQALVLMFMKLRGLMKRLMFNQMHLNILKNNQQVLVRIKSVENLILQIYNKNQQKFLKLQLVLRLLKVQLHSLLVKLKAILSQK